MERKKFVKLLIFSVFLALGIQILFGETSYGRYIKGSVPVEIASSSGYEVQDSHYLVTQEDPQIFLRPSSAVQLINVEFAEPVSQDIDIVVYFAKEGEGFSQNNSRSLTIYANDTSGTIEIPFNQYEAIRVDIGNLQGEFFDLSEISIYTEQISKWERMFSKLNVVQSALLILGICLILFGLDKYKKNHPADAMRLVEPDTGIPALFLKIVIPVGVFLVFFSMPLSSPDEAVHFVNAYTVSRGQFFPHVIDGSLCKDVPENLLEFLHYWIPKIQSQDYDNVKYTAYDFFEMGRSWTQNQTSAIYVDVTTKISPLCYLMSAGGMVVGRMIGQLFSDPALNELPSNMLIYGRLGNLCFYVIVTYVALKIAPRFKRVMLLLATMPMSLFLGASLNHDAILIPVSLLFVAILLKLCDERTSEIENIDIFIVLFCVFFLVAVKKVYACLLLLLLAVPKKKYGSAKRMRLCIAAVIGVVILAYSPEFILMEIGKGLTLPGQEERNAQMEYMCTHLTQMPAVFFNTVKQFGYFYLESFFGKLGWLNIPMPIPAITIFYTILTFASIFEIGSSAVWSNHWKRLLPLISGTVGILVVVFAQYHSHTPQFYGIGSPFAVGVQGRYFIPLFLPCILVFSNGFLGRVEHIDKIRNFTTSLVKCCAIGCGLMTVMIVIWRFL